MTDAPRSRTMGDLIVRNIATLFAGRGLATVISAGAAILLARYLGREQLGHYGAVYAFVGLFGWIATFGIELAQMLFDVQTSQCQVLEPPLVLGGTC